MPTASPRRNWASPEVLKRNGLRTTWAYLRRRSRLGLLGIALTACSCKDCPPVRQLSASAIVPDSGNAIAFKVDAYITESGRNATDKRYVEIIATLVKRPLVGDAALLGRFGFVRLQDSTGNVYFRSVLTLNSRATTLATPPSDNNATDALVSQLRARVLSGQLIVVLESDAPTFSMVPTRLALVNNYDWFAACNGL